MFHRKKGNNSVIAEAFGTPGKYYGTIFTMSIKINLNSYNFVFFIN